jgi:ribosome-binding protein aMBF1 (putative translation factor)
MIRKSTGAVPKVEIEIAKRRWRDFKERMDAGKRHARKSAAYRKALEEQLPYEQFARLVIRKRMQLGLTQQELAKRMGKV